MLAPWEWLKEYFPTKLTAQEAGEILTMAGVAVEGILADDVLEFELTPNLAHCLSLTGLAGELAALTGEKARPPQGEPLPIGLAAFPVQVEAEGLCQRYAALQLAEVQVAPSPEWLQSRLRGAGIRPINNVVDVTNYVMLELGQPMHAFDAQLLVGGEIRVRLSRGNEALTTLDGVQRKLDPGFLIIADGTQPIALAGVMGGEGSGVTVKTVDVLLESAWFAPGEVRRCAKALGLHSESSHRFERVVDPKGQVQALERAAFLLREIGGGGKAVAFTDHNPVPAVPKRINFRPDQVNALLGTDIPEERLRLLVTSLGMRVGGEWTVEVPTSRPDITLEVDLAEEVARLYGYANIPETPPVGPLTQGKLNFRQKGRRKARAALAGAGLREVMTFGLVGAGLMSRSGLAHVPVRSLVNPLVEEESYLRPSLLPCFLTVLATNASRKVDDVAIFEVANVFLEDREEERVGIAIMGDFPRGDWHCRGEKAGFFTMKGVVEELVAAFGLEGEYRPMEAAPFAEAARVLVDGVEVGLFGRLDPRVAVSFDLRGEAFLAELALVPLLNKEKRRVYRPLPRFPAMERDVAAVFSEGIPVGQVAGAIREAAGDILEGLSLFDVYTGPQAGEGKRSLAYALVYRSPEGTLTEDRVEEAQDRVRAALREMGGELRG